MQPWKVLSGLRQSSATDTIRVTIIFYKRRRPPAELARDNFPTAGNAIGRATETATATATDTDTAAETATETATATNTDTATESHKCAAVESPLGAQTVLGDRHDPFN